MRIVPSSNANQTPIGPAGDSRTQAGPQVPADAGRRHSKREALKNRARRPEALPVSIASIPRLMRRVLRWCLWVWQWSVRRCEWSKVPKRPVGTNAKSTDPSTWCDFATAVAAYERGGFDGLGFMLGDGWVGVDLDGVLAPETGTLHPVAARIVASLSSYTEVSPTGTGVKTFLRGTLPKGRRRREDLFGPGTGIETYDNDRYFTVTGGVTAGAPNTVEERTKQVVDLWHAYIDIGDQRRDAGPKRHTKDTRGTALRHRSDNDGPGDHPQGHGKLADQEVVERARHASDGAKFSQLYGGQWQGAFPSQSEADLALVRFLYFWTQGDAQQIDRLFRHSGLYRQKWDRSVGGRRTYGERTLEMVLSSGGPMYSGKSRNQRSQARTTIAAIRDSAELSRWSGIGGATDKVVFDCLVDLAMAVGSVEFGASVRWIAEQANIKANTASRSTRRLAARGYLIRVKLGHGESATRWRLSLPPAAGEHVRAGDSHLHTRGGGGDCAQLGHLLPEDGQRLGADDEQCNGQHHYHRRRLHGQYHTGAPAHDLWRWGKGRGKVAGRVYGMLGSRPVSTAAVATKLGIKIAGASKHLRHLREDGLALHLHRGFWIRGSANLETLAKKRGVAGAGSRDIVRHKQERADYRARLRLRNFRLVPGRSARRAALDAVYATTRRIPHGGRTTATRHVLAWVHSERSARPQHT